MRNAGTALELLTPDRELAAGLVEHPGADLGDHPGLLGGGDERQRRHGAPRRVVPADERLEALDASAGQLDDGLVVEVELVALDGVAQLALEEQALAGAVAHGVVEHGDGVVARRPSPRTSRCRRRGAAPPP